MAGPANCIWGRRWRSAWRPPTPCPTGIPITAEERLVAGGDAPFILDLVQGEAGSRQWIEEKMAWFIPLAGAGAIDGEPWRRGECWLIEGTAALTIDDGMSALRSEEHTSELQSPMRISYAVFCLKKKKRAKNEL